MDSIILSKKHGVNVSVEACSLCGKDTGNILLLGKLKDDKEAPRRSNIGNVCDECKGAYDKGAYLLIEVRDDEVGENPYRTGHIWWVTKEAGERWKLESRTSYIEESAAEKMGFNTKQE